MGKQGLKRCDLSVGQLPASFRDIGRARLNFKGGIKMTIEEAKGAYDSSEAAGIIQALSKTVSNGDLAEFKKLVRCLVNRVKNAPPT